MPNNTELYRDFLDRKFDELLQAIQAISGANNEEVEEDDNT